MSNGTRTTETLTLETVKYTYPGIVPDSPVTVVVQNGLMLVSAAVDGDLWTAQLPLAAAPLMVQIAADMVDELAAQTPATTTDPTPTDTTTGPPATDPATT